MASKAETMKVLADATGLSRRQVETVVDALVTHVGEQVKSGAEVDVYGFGKFTRGNTARRMGRNPRTGKETGVVEPKPRVVFRAHGSFNSKTFG